MANPEHLARRHKGVDIWNAWREEHTDLIEDLRGSHLVGANLVGANLCGANLGRARLSGAKLGRANLFEAKLSA